MHDLLARALAKARPEPALATIGGRHGITVVLAFAQDRAYPEWVAKIASGAEASATLAAEHRALETLKPWTESLALPRITDWHDDPCEAALIISGMPGFSRHFSIGAETGNARDGQDLRSAIAWLARFRESVPLEVVPATPSGPAFDPDPALRGVVAWLRESPADFAESASHGDFWCGNLIYDNAGQPGVIDWDGLGRRSRLHDLLSLLANCAYRERGALQLDVSVPRFCALFFGDGPGAHFAHEAVRELAPSEPELRRSFYVFLAESLRLKGGTYRQVWRDIAEILTQEGLPTPWTRPLSRI